MPKPNGELTYDEAERMVQIGLDPNEYRSAKGTGGKYIEGYLATWDSPTKIGGKDGFTETIRPGAFAKTLKDGSDIVASINHNLDRVLGRRSNGSLELREDSKGLWFRCKLPEGVSYAVDAFALVESQTLKGCSFMGNFVKDSWNASYTSRDVHEIQLLEGGPVAMPAYLDTSVNISRDASPAMGNARAYADDMAEIRSIENTVFPPNRKHTMEDMEIMKRAESLIANMPETSDLRMRVTERADGSRFESIELRNMLRKYGCRSLVELRSKMGENAEIRSAFEALAVRAEMLAKGEAV